MQTYDLVMIAVLVAAVAWGAWKGLAWQIASLASLVLSYFVALRFRQSVAQLIDASPPWNQFLAMLILFLGTGLVVWVVFNLVSELIERVKLKEFDRQLGALFGAAKGVLLCVLITLFSMALLGDSQRQAICNSRSGYYIAVLLDRAGTVIPPELHEVLEPYLHDLDRNVTHDHRAGLQADSQDRGVIEARPASGSFGAAPQPASGSFSAGVEFGGVQPRIIVQPEDEAALRIELPKR